MTDATAKKTDKARNSAMTETKSAAPRVAVLGGGLAGLSAATKLLKAGFSVTIFEADAVLGGNASSYTVDGVDHDVYPHMFCEWYVNFWHLFEKELGLSRKASFEAKPGVKMLKSGEAAYHSVLNPTSIEAAVANLKSGVMSPAQMILLGFSELDLLAFPFARSGMGQLQQLDVNGFLYSRGYTTEAVADMENYILSLIWSIPSVETAAATYQNFLRHSWQFPNHAPFAWMLKGSLASKLIDPLKRHLEKLGCDIRLNTPVTALRIVNDMPVVFTDDRNDQGQVFDYVVCALNAAPLASLVMAAPAAMPGRALVECEASLADLQRLRAVPIPVVDLYLKSKLQRFPNDVIGLAGSHFGLSVLDISQLWDNVDFGDKTALIIAASEAASIPSQVPEQMGWLMIKELSEFYKGQIQPGEYWGDPNANIDWARSHVRPNLEHQLFLNDVGSWAWRPEASYPETLPRVAFAGDLCRNGVDMATMEGAMITGITAARAVQDADAAFNRGFARGKPIEALPHTVYSNVSLRAAKLCFLPLAYAALGVVAFQEWYKHKDDPDSARQGNHFPVIDYLALVPMQFTIDWWKGAFWLARSLTGNDEAQDPFGASGDESPFIARTRPDRPSIHPNEQTDEPGQPGENEIGLGAAVLMVMGECADYALSHLDTAARSKHTGSGEKLIGGLARMTRTFLGELTHNENHHFKRYWRPKR